MRYSQGGAVGYPASEVAREAPVNSSAGSPDPLLVTIVLGTLAVGLPIVFALAIRFLWERTLSLGRSKELEKLIWQLHRIASAMEHQMNLSYPAVKPGTEEARDIAYLKEVVPAAKAAMAAASATGVAVAAVPQPTAAASQEAGAQTPPALPPLEERHGEMPRAGVNSMFGL
jgi:hypothetical protein